MQTVLKGRTNEDRKSFFTSQFTGASSYCRNPEALHAWLEQLERTPKDNITIAWITSMLHPDRTKRIATSLLTDKILNYQGEHVYHGLCCTDQSDSETSSNTSSPTQAAHGYAQSSRGLDSYFTASHNQQLSNEEVNAGAAIAGATRNVKSLQPAVDVNSVNTKVDPALPEGVEIQPQPDVPIEAVRVHGKGFDPNPAPSSAIQAVDRLLGPQRINTGLNDARPVQSTDRMDALWQPAYLSALDTVSQEHMNILPTRTWEADYNYYIASIDSARVTYVPPAGVGVEQTQSSQPGPFVPENNMQMENTTLNSAQRVSQLPSWDEVMNYTGISRCKGW